MSVVSSERARALAEFMLDGALVCINAEIAVEIADTLVAYAAIRDAEVQAISRTKAENKAFIDAVMDADYPTDPDGVR